MASSRKSKTSNRSRKKHVYKKRKTLSRRMSYGYEHEYDNKSCCSKIDELVLDIHGTLNKLSRSRRTTMDPDSKELEKFLKVIENLRNVLENKETYTLVTGKNKDVGYLVSEIQKAIFGTQSGEPNYPLIRDLLSRSAKEILGKDVSGRFDLVIPVNKDKQKMKEYVEKIRKDEDKLQAMQNLYDYIFVGK